MIEDKEKGIKIAENHEEALFTRLLKESEMLIKQSEDNLIIQKAIKQMAEKVLEKWKNK